MLQNPGTKRRIRRWQSNRTTGPGTPAWSIWYPATRFAGASETRTIYEGQILDEEWFAIVAGASNEATALEFLAYMAEPEQQAAQARWIPYGPMRRSALGIIEAGELWFHTGQPVLPHLPSRDDRIEDAIVLDPEFWAENGEALTNRFAEWRRGLGL